MSAHSILIFALMVMSMFHKAASNAPYTKIICDSSSLATLDISLQANENLIGCAALCTQSSCLSFHYSEDSCTIYEGSGLSCPADANVTTGTEVYVQSTVIQSLQVLVCPQNYPYAINNGSTCCSNYTKINDTGINAACDGTIISQNDPADCCDVTTPCIGVRCVNNPRFASGCLLTGYDSSCGNLVYYTNVANETVCQQRCQQYPGCDWFTYKTAPAGDSLFCYLKKASWMYRRGTTHIGGPAHCNGYGCLMVNTDIATYSSVGSQTTAANEYYCQMNCQGNTNCTHFTYNSSNKVCFLRNNVGEFVDAQNLITGPAYCY